MNDYETSYGAASRRTHSRKRREALAKPWPFKGYAYLEWMMDAWDPGWAFAAIWCVAVLHVAAAVLVVYALAWAVAIGAGWVVCLALGAGAALGLRVAVLRAIEFDRQYREGPTP